MIRRPHRFGHLMCPCCKMVDCDENWQNVYITPKDVIYGGRCVGMAKKLSVSRCNQFPYVFALMVLCEKAGKKGVIMKEWAAGWLSSACSVDIHHCQDSLRGIIYSPMGCMAPHTLLIFIWPERDRARERARDRVGSSEFFIHFSISQCVSRGRMEMAVSGHAEVAGVPASWSTSSAVTSTLRKGNSYNTKMRCV